MWKSVASNALTFFVVALFVFGGLIQAGISRYNAPGPLTEGICIKVDRGSNFDRVAKDLQAAGAIEGRSFYRIGVDYADKARDLKAGAYLVPAGASMADITELLTSTGRSTCGSEIIYRLGVTRLTVQVRSIDASTGKYETLAIFNPSTDETPEAFTNLQNAADTQMRLAVAEGITSWQIVDGLNKIDFLKGSVDAIPAEGSLAPDSYAITAGMDRAQIVAEMQAAQTARITSVWEARAENAPVTTPEEMVTLASIIEKETALADERGLVAAVFANRLRQGMRLQTDPTVIYGITKGEGTLGRGLRRSELRNPTPWNTYTIDGLPPTPIANPGLESLKAAVNTEESDFIFFVADGTGGHAFATNLADHNRNVARWRQIEAEAAAQ
ncbi:MAG: endolytic transglycosylase MltG [Planktomarina sp.]